MIGKYKYESNTSWMLPKYGMKDLQRLMSSYSKCSSNELFHVEVLKRSFSQYFITQTQSFEDLSYNEKLLLLDEIHSVASKKSLCNTKDLGVSLLFIKLWLLFKENRFDQDMFEKWVSYPHINHNFMAPRDGIIASLTRHVAHETYNGLLTTICPEVNDRNKVNKLIRAYIQHLTVEKNISCSTKYTTLNKESVQHFEIKYKYLNNLPYEDKENKY